MLEIIVQAAITATCLYIWFETDAAIEYLKLIDNLFGLITKEKNEIIEKFDKQRKLSPSISLPEFFCIENNNFLARLFACPTCLGVWINIIPSLVMSAPLSYYFPSLMLSFFLYYGLNKLING